jgi:hypothetical protein
MNPDPEIELEAEIDGLLKELPELAAPETLARRVLGAIEQRTRRPWYRHSWQEWPLSLRWAFLAVLAALFGGLVFGGWRLAQTQTAEEVLNRAAAWISVCGTVGKTIHALTSSAALVFEHIGPGFKIGCVAAMLLGYALCVGLGVIYVRIGLAATSAWSVRFNSHRAENRPVSAFPNPPL